MKQKQVVEWLEKSENRKSIITHLKQPMTALQLTKYTGLSLDQCSMLLGQLTLCRLVKCLNPTAKRSRLYWLTPIGILCQRKLRNDKNLPSIAKNLPDTDWELYGWLCYSHRAAIIRTLTEPMQPATIKRKAVQQNPQMKMSANNVRDVIKLFLQKGLVRKVIAKRKVHPKYELTQQGIQLKNILTEAGV
ncbi:MAG: hypothetical protein A2Y10_06055 [Planctomycetes bacterium GWF2_41_51]|nr:MAG: hypothetical protein A2Y10_06055 [Planctomycetes bacterium GWF2_41_51]